MKTGTNFSFPFDRGLPVLAGLGWTVALLGLGLAAGLVLDGLRLRSESPALAKTLLKLQSEPVTALSPAGLPSARSLADLRRQLGDLNALGAGDGPSTAGILAELERLTPPAVRLLSFQSDRESGAVRLVAEAMNLDDLSRFLEALEKSDSFASVNLAKQTQARDGSSDWIQFSMDLTVGPQ